MCKIIPIGGTTCSECGGGGQIEVLNDSWGWSADTIKCPTCDGKGYVFEESEVSDETWD